MRSRRLSIDSCGIGLANSGSKVEGIHEIIHRVDFNLSQASQDDVALGVFTNSHVPTLIHRSSIGHKKIAQLFVVNLDIGSFQRPIAVTELVLLTVTSRASKMGKRTAVCLRGGGFGSIKLLEESDASSRNYT